MTEANTAPRQVHMVSEALGEPKWLLELRENAWNLFESAPEPYLEKTNLRRRGWETGAFSTGPPDLPEAVSTYVSGLNHSYALFSDGHLLKVHLSDAAKANGIVFSSIHDAMQEHENLVKPHFGSVVEASENKWSALNLALFSGGAFVHVPRNVQFDEAIEIVHYVSSSESGSYPRTLVVADELSQVDVVEVSFSAPDRPKVTASHVCEIVAKPSSRVRFGTADEFVKGPTYFVTRRAEVQKDAIVEWVVSDISDGFTVQLVENALKGTGARGITRVVGLGYARQHMDLTASMIHEGRHTESDIVMHGVLHGKANSIYRSRTEIIKGAIGAGSEQHDRMIMLDGSARADAIPMLLIDENDVQRCGHAASVGKIDPIQIYYLMSRGISKEDATKMIIWGYLQDSVGALPTEEMRDLVIARIERKL